MKMYLKNADIEIDIEDILRRCKENMEDGGKYILTPQSEEINNPANIVPLEEKALMELFKTGTRKYCKKSKKWKWIHIVEKFCFC